MKKKHLIIIGAVAIVIVILIVLMPSIGDTFSRTDSELVVDSGLPIDQNLAQSETLFINQIQQLQQIDLSQAQVLDNPEFQQLQDNTVELSEIEAGRSNPFSPIDARVIIEQRNTTIPTNNTFVPQSSPTQATNQTSTNQASTNSPNSTAPATNSNNQVPAFNGNVPSF
jgi:hypothetical protein